MFVCQTVYLLSFAVVDVIILVFLPHVTVTNKNKLGSKVLRQWPINLYTSLMMIHKITPSVDLNYSLKRVDT